jgi:hypothetical protein
MKKKQTRVEKAAERYFESGGEDKGIMAAFLAGAAWQRRECVGVVRQVPVIIGPPHYFLYDAAEFQEMAIAALKRSGKGK